MTYLYLAEDVLKLLYLFFSLPLLLATYLLDVLAGQLSKPGGVMVANGNRDCRSDRESFEAEYS